MARHVWLPSGAAADAFSVVDASRTAVPAPNEGQRRRRCQARWLLGAVLALVGAGVISCGTVSHTLVPPPQVAGAKYVGSKTCSDCHEEVIRDFATSTHGRLQAKGTNAWESGCESCHGPGSVHADAGGGKDNIINPSRSATGCFQCHLDLRGRFNLPSHHPVGEGRVTCSSCHNPHKGPALVAGGNSAIAENEACMKCHPRQRGPHVFEHEALREGCTTCHNPHGSVNAKLLVARNATLCLRCHFQQQRGSSVSLLIGGQDHRLLLSKGTCWTAGCHEAVHGSMVNSTLRY